MSINDYWPGKYRGRSGAVSIANLSTAADHGRLNEPANFPADSYGPTSPIPGSEWVDPQWPYSQESYQRDVQSMVDATAIPIDRLRTMSPTGKPLVDEFAAVRLIGTMQAAEDVIFSNRLRLRNALNDYRKANPIEKPAMLAQLRVVYEDINSRDWELQADIEDIVNTL